MICDAGALRRFERDFELRHRLSHRQALASVDALWAEGRALGVLPPQGPHGGDRGRHPCGGGPELVFEEILASLVAAHRRHGIPSMVIGGQDVLLYGEPRLTKDIDVTLGVDSVRHRHAPLALRAAAENQDRRRRPRR